MDALTQTDPLLAVGLIGSRAKGNPKEFSDWDLGVTKGIKDLNWEEFSQLKTTAADLADDLPRFIDLINLSRAPQWFKQGMSYQPVFLKGNAQSWQSFLEHWHESA